MKLKLPFILFMCLCLVLSSLVSCGDSRIPDDTEGKEEQSTALETESATESDTEAEAEEDPNLLHIAAKGETSVYQIVGGIKEDMPYSYAIQLASRIKDAIGIDLPVKTDNYAKQETDYEILVGTTFREEYVALAGTLEKDEYAIKAYTEGSNRKVIIAYNGVYALLCAVERFVSEYVDAERGVVEVPIDLDIKGTFTEEDTMIVSTISRLRDPCVLVEDGIYYIYGTGWECLKNTSGSLRGEWTSLGVVAQKPADCDGDYWAPEVHKYNGAYYMFTTYHSSKTGHRGCTIMKSDSPEGPFVEITNGHITPHDWDSIDGTFYIDTDGQPWMIFVHEWTSTDDGVGRMAAAKLSSDLTHFISEPIELFRARDPGWARGNITDGCWMYRCEAGQLLMLWSNKDSGGYCVGVARSVSGRVDGEWTQDTELLYSKNKLGTYEGGHGMIFYDTDGQMYLSIHSPNSQIGDRKETPIFIPIKEVDGKLVWDVFKY